MKKAWRWVLGALLAVILLFALFVWDAIRRAESAIDAHERQVALDIAGLRAAHAQLPPIPQGLRALYLSGELNATFLKRLIELESSQIFYEYESEDRTDGWFWFYLDSSRVWSRPQAAQILANLALPQDMMRGGGVDRALSRQSLEQEALREWKNLLESHELSATDLEVIAATLDDLLRRRAGPRDALEGERAIDRLRVIRVLRTKSDNRTTLTEKPGWRSLFLWRIFIARTLTSLERMYREQAQIASLPPHERVDAAVRQEQDCRQSGRAVPVSRWPVSLAVLYREEGEGRRDWILARLATAIAWFEVEHGRFPENLEALVPKHIEAIPLNPASGLPFFYSNGTLGASEEPGEKEVWRISRKSDASGKPRNP